MESESYLSQLVPVVKQVGEFIQSAKISASDIQEKDMNSLVTFVDKEAELKLVKALSSIIPEAGFITEEETIATEKKDWMWIIDPLDGTTNFIHGVPCYSISIALHHKSRPVLGVVYELNHQEMFTAIVGQGSFRNGEKISVSEHTHLNEALIATGFPYTRFDFMEWYVNIFKKLIVETRGIRRFGSAAVDLCYVACGRFDCFFEKGLNVWDVAAGAIILSEAGGVVSDFSGNDNFLFGGEMLGANKSIHQKSLDLISKA